MSILEQKLCEIKVIYPDHLFIVSGDLNARTKDQDDFIFDDSANYLPLPAFYSSDSFCMSRKSKDLTGEINEHGKQILNLCCTYDIHFLNGRTSGDPYGELTCFTANGSSLVDYTIVSTTLFDQVISFEIGHEDQYTHLPQIFSVMTKLRTSETSGDSAAEPDSGTVNKERLQYTWTPDSMDKLLSSDQIAYIMSISKTVTQMTQQKQ